MVQTHINKGGVMPSDYAKTFFGHHLVVRNCGICGYDRYGCTLEVLYENMENGEIHEEYVCPDCKEDGSLYEYKQTIKRKMKRKEK
jgi:ribosomal protein L37AE/L43A